MTHTSSGNRSKTHPCNNGEMPQGHSPTLKSWTAAAGHRGQGRAMINTSPHPGASPPRALRTLETSVGKDLVAHPLILVHRRLQWLPRHPLSSSQECSKGPLLSRVPREPAIQWTRDKPLSEQEIGITHCASKGGLPGQSLTLCDGWECPHPCS